MPQGIRMSLVPVLLASGVACAGRSQSSSSAAPIADTASSPASSGPAPASPRLDSTWLVSDAAGKTATLSLVVTRPAGSPSALINGHRAGGARVVVPLHWTVKWNWRNDDPGAAHSLVVMTQREKLPLEGGRSAFSNAMSRSVTAGLSTGQADQTTFEAEEGGWYWLMCGAPTHAINGEWIELRVDPDASSASVRIKQP
jgi:hypothetical protein